MPNRGENGKSNVIVLEIAAFCVTCRQERPTRELLWCSLCERYVCWMCGERGYCRESTSGTHLPLEEAVSPVSGPINGENSEGVVG